MTTLLIADHNNASLNDGNDNTLSAAKALGSDIHILVAGNNADEAANQAAKLDGTAKVLLANAPSLENQLAENMATLILSLSDQYDAIIAPATTMGKNILPRVAALLDVMQISDITDVLDANTFERPIYAGNALQTVKSNDTKKIITVRTTAFDPAEQTGSANIETIEFTKSSDQTTFISEEVSQSERPELTSAKTIISGGRALGSKEKFDEVILPVADKLGAAIGASRAAVDAGYAPNDWQVGQTGKVVAPDLYIACGISGAIQHLAGMKDSKVIVAINKDDEAPIFQVADYGLVADLFEALPEMEKAI